MKKVHVINLYKHSIVHHNIKNKQPKTFFISLGIFAIVLFSLSYIYFVNDFVNQSVNTFNPISGLYRDVEVASFVGGGSVNIIVPIKTSSYQIKNDFIIFTVEDSIMVYAPATGVVEEVSVAGNKKSIKIKHSEELYTVVENVDVVGVKAGEVVKQGKEVATAKAKSEIVFYIIDHDKLANNLTLNKSFVKWNQN